MSTDTPGMPRGWLRPRKRRTILKFSVLGPLVVWLDACTVAGGAPTTNVANGTATATLPTAAATTTTTGPSTPQPVTQTPAASGATMLPAAKAWNEGGLRLKFTGTNSVDGLPYHGKVGLIHVNALDTTTILEAMQPWVDNNLYWALRLVVAGRADGSSDVLTPPTSAGLGTYTIQYESGYTTTGVSKPGYTETGYRWWDTPNATFHGQLSQAFANVFVALPERNKRAWLYTQISIANQGEATVLKDNLSKNELGSALYLTRYQARVTQLEAQSYTDDRFHDTIIAIATAWKPVKTQFPGMPLVISLNPHGVFLQQTLYDLSGGQFGTATGRTVEGLAEELLDIGFSLQFDGVGKSSGKLPPALQDHLSVGEQYTSGTTMEAFVAELQTLNPKAALAYPESVSADSELFASWGRQTPVIASAPIQNGYSLV